MPELKGGDKLNNALARIAADLKKPGTLRVGFLAGATYPDGKPVAMIAAFNEFGVPSHGQPPRPFFRNMIAKNKGGWPNLVKVALKNANYDTPKALKVVGEVLRGQLVQSIVDTNAPPLADSTKKRKGFDKPLIDSGHMMNSVDYEVK